MDLPTNSPSIIDANAPQAVADADPPDIPVLRIPLTPQLRSMLIRDVSTSVEESYSGPLPPPGMLQEYDRTLPGLAERIVKLVEGEQAFRHNMVAKEHDADIARQKDDLVARMRGQLFTFSAIVLGIILGGMMTYNGGASAAAWMVGTIFTTSVVAMITLRRHIQKVPEQELPEPPVQDEQK